MVGNAAGMVSGEVIEQQATGLHFGLVGQAEVVEVVGLAETCARAGLASEPGLGVLVAAVFGPELAAAAAAVVVVVVVLGFAVVVAALAGLTWGSRSTMGEAAVQWKRHDRSVAAEAFAGYTMG
jgi:uncharacterized membrane protein